MERLSAPFKTTFGNKNNNTQTSHVCKLSNNNIFPSLPIFEHESSSSLSDNTSPSSTTFMKLLEKYEIDERSIKAGGFVIRLTDYEGMRQKDLEAMLDKTRLWSRQSFSPQTTKDAYKLELTKLNNKNEKGAKKAKYKSCEGGEAIWKQMAEGNTIAYYRHDYESSIHQKYIPWDFNTLGNSPNVLSGLLTEDVPGINSTFGYLGTAGAMFAWHIEDVHLCSANICLGGGSKMWYTLSPKYQGDFNSILKDIFNCKGDPCPGIVEHKQCVVSPYVIDKLLQEKLARQLFPSSNSSSLDWETRYKNGKRFKRLKNNDNGFNRSNKCNSKKRSGQNTVLLQSISTTRFSFSIEDGDAYCNKKDEDSGDATDDSDESENDVSSSESDDSEACDELFNNKKKQRRRNSSKQQVTIEQVPLIHSHEQLPGDIVCMLGSAYHSGYSTSLNYGEALNYATQRWFNDRLVMPKAKCTCKTQFSFHEELWNSAKPNV